MSKNGNDKPQLEEGQIILDLDSLEKHAAALVYGYERIMLDRMNGDESERRFYNGHIRGIQQVMKAIREYRKIEQDISESLFPRSIIDNMREEMFKITNRGSLFNDGSDDVI